MKKKNPIEYFSKDKMYTVKDDIIKNHPKAICIFLFSVSCLFLIISALSFVRSFNFNKSVEKAQYSINGESNYTVYLKDNDYYEQDFLGSGMQYVASLIKVVNTYFNYELHATKELDLNYTYKVVGTLNVYDKDNKSKSLYTKIYTLDEGESLSTTANNIVINKSVDIDYGIFNEYVGRYLSDYALNAAADLEVALEVNIDGEYENSKQAIAAGKVMTIDIPLSEQTLDINISNSSINSSERFFDSQSYSVSNLGLFIVSAVCLIISLYLVVISTKLTKKYINENIYMITLDKILREYDRIIVNGSITVNESNFTNKIYVDSFEELVDASQSFNEPILFYNVIPGEKCFFVIIKGDTLYKMRLTKAYLENERKNKTTKTLLDIKPEQKEQKVEEKKENQVEEVKEEKTTEEKSIVKDTKKENKKSKKNKK